MFSTRRYAKGVLARAARVLNDVQRVSVLIVRRCLRSVTARFLQLNSPTKIKGTWALLKKRFGAKDALEVIQKNPGAPKSEQQ